MEESNIFLIFCQLQYSVIRDIAMPDKLMKDSALGNSDAKLATVQVRYKNPETGGIETSEKAVPVADADHRFNSASPHFRFTAAVAESAEILKKATGPKAENWMPCSMWPAKPQPASAPGNRKTNFSHSCRRQSRPE